MAMRRGVFPYYRNNENEYNIYKYNVDEDSDYSNGVAT